MDFFATKNTTICCSVFYYLWGLILFLPQKSAFIFMWSPGLNKWVYFTDVDW